MLQIRRARDTDIASLQGIRRSISDDLPLNQRDRTESWFVACLERNGRGWLSLINDQATGFVIVDLTDNSINSLYVKPQWQHMGAGNALLTTACDHLFCHGAKRIRLETEYNSDAFRFYLKRGWEVESTSCKGPVTLTLSQPQTDDYGAKRSTFQ